MIGDMVDKLLANFRWLRLAFLLGVVLIVGITAVRYYSKADKPSRTGERNRTAFLRWRSQILDLDQGVDIYRAHQYPNPPIMALVLYPLMQIPPMAGAMLWFTLKVVMGGFMVLWTYRWLAALSDRPRTLFWQSILGIAILLSLHPMLGDLAHGNVNLFIGFLVFAALECYRRRWDFSAGVVLALSIACKVTPALFVPYFLWKRNYRVLAGVGVGLFLWFQLIPGAVLGWETNNTLLVSWYDGMVKPFLVEGKVTSEHHNQSLPGFLFRLFTREPSFVGYDEDDRAFAEAYHTVIDIGAPIIRKVLLFGQIAFLAAMVLLCRTPTNRKDSLRAGPIVLAEFSFILLGMLLWSERTWKHHAVTQIAPVAVLVWAALAPEHTRRFRSILGGMLAVIAMLIVVPSMLSEESQDLTLVYGSYTAVYTLELFGIGAILFQHLRTGEPINEQKSPGLARLLQGIPTRSS